MSNKGSIRHGKESKRAKPKSNETDRSSDNIEYRGLIYTRNNYFADRKRKVDFVLVTSVLKDSGDLDTLITFIINLVQQGVQYEISRGTCYPNLVFIKLHCPAPVLQHYANIYNILFDCQNPRDFPRVENAWFSGKAFNNITTTPSPLHRDYPRAITSLSYTKEKGIMSWERSLVMDKILNKTEFGPRTGDRGIKKLRELKVILDAYPTHDGPWKWKEHGPLTDRQNQPIRLIYKYYGPEIAFYFAFYDFYTKMLLIPAILGICCFLYNWLYSLYQDQYRITEVCTSAVKLCPTCYYPKLCNFVDVSDYCYAAKYNVLFDNIVGIAFAIFSSMWSTIFVGLWQRREFVFKFHWNLLNSQVDMTQRVEFENKANNTKVLEWTGERVKYMPVHIKIFKHLLTVICFTLVISLILLTLGIIIYTKLYLQKVITAATSRELKRHKDFITITINAMQAILIIKLLKPNLLYISKFLTNEENPPSMLDYYNSCTYKYYALSFFNNYVPIFYVALIKGSFYTYPSDMDNYTQMAWKTDVCIFVGCTFTLTMFLTYFMGTKFVLSPGYNLIKLIYLKIKERKPQPRPRKPSIPAWERDYLLKKCGDFFLIAEFMDLVIQYGFVIFFIAGFQLSPVLALITNIIQVRVEARKFLRTFRRPVAKVLPGIGSWNSLLRFVTFVGAITNALVIAFTSDLIEIEVYRNTHDTLSGFVNSTFSEFAVKDYPPRFAELLKQDPSVETCAYEGRRNPPNSENKYAFSEDHWKIFFYKLCFVLIFQQMIWLLTAFCSNAISPVPDDVLEELNDEALKVRENRFESLTYHAYSSRIPRSNFQIE